MQQLAIAGGGAQRVADLQRRPSQRHWSGSRLPRLRLQALFSGYSGGELGLGCS